MGSKNDCLFCKIIAGEVPSHKVLENDKVLAFLDISPAGTTGGHILIVPKKHVISLEECDNSYLEAMILAAKKLTGVLKVVFKAEGLNLLQNDGRIAGQLVPHLHFHLIPRTQGDGIFIEENRQSMSTEELKKNAKKIKDALKE